MIGEGAADICTTLAREVRELRAHSGEPTASMQESISRLLTAPATTSMDALALMAMSRRLLCHVLGVVRAEDPMDMDSPDLPAIFATACLARAIQVLEAQTGYSAEGFTGESDAVN